MFAFNFMPADDNDNVQSSSNNKNINDNNCSIVSSLSVGIDKKHGSNGSTVTSAISHPFSWKQNIQELLEGRSQQEIVYQDVILKTSDNYNVVEAQEGKNSLTLSLSPPLRRVCMEQYQQEVTPGVYEGGLQVWECSLDLVRYFQRHHKDVLSLLPLGECEENPKEERQLQRRRVLELGCGHGLPGCYILQQLLLQKEYRKLLSLSSSLSEEKQQQQPEDIDTRINLLQQQQQSPPLFTVSFVDYNDYVIDDVTLSNVILNTAGIISAKQLAQYGLVQFGSGDWNDMSQQLLDPSSCFSSSNTKSSSSSSSSLFDWIIAAETIYTTAAARETAEILLKHLVLETGIGWIASKRYYFGVGGGTDAFRQAAEELLSKEQQRQPKLNRFLKIETAQVIDNGVGNIREILKVTCHANDKMNET